MRFNIFTSLQRAFRPRKQQSSLIVTEAEVSLLTDGKETWRFRWNQITRIETYKQDLFSVDLICLDFFVESLQLPYRINEEMQGFQELMKYMRQLFPSIDENWHRQVTFPAFAANHKVLYERQPANEHRDLRQ
jgi:hypothetical protein